MSVSPTCPHCSKELGSGFLTQETLTERLKGPAKVRDDAIADAAQAKADAAAAKEAAEKVKADAAKTKADAEAAIAAARADAEAAKAQATKAQSDRDRFAALASNNIVAPAKVRGISSAYDLYASEQGDAAKPFAEWLASDARADEFLAPHFAAVAAVANADAGKAGAADAGAKADAKAAPAQTAGKALPAANVAVGQTPGGTGKLTQGQAAEAYSKGVDDIIARKLPKPEREKAIAELKQQIAGQVSA